MACLTVGESQKQLKYMQADVAGVLLVHRSGDSTVGVHGNSGLWLPEPGSHRLSLVLYQTDLKQG